MAGGAGACTDSICELTDNMTYNMNYWLGYFMEWTVSKTWYNHSSAAIKINPVQFIGYGGAAFAFLLSLLGAWENVGQLVSEVEGSMDTWLEVYSDGTYKSYVEDAEKSDSMQTFINVMTWDLIIYSCASVFHSMLLMLTGYGAAGIIFWYTKPYVNDGDTSNDRTAYIESWRSLLFGVLVGTANYMGGHVTKHTINDVMNAMGFNTHEYNDESFLQISTSVTSGGTTTTTTQSPQLVEVDYDYEKLLHMQDNWSDFFMIQRYTQLGAPYLFQFCVETAIMGVLFFSFFLIKFI